MTCLRGSRPLARGALVLGLVLCIVGESAAQANLVPNPSLEAVDPTDATRPEGWEPNSWGDVKAAFQYLTSGADGQRSLRIELSSKGTEGDAKWWSLPFAVPAGGGKYTVSDKYRSSVTSEIVLQVLGGTGQEDWLLVKTTPVAAGWTAASGVVELPSWATKVRVAHVLATPGWLETDSFSMEPWVSPGDGAADGGPAGDGAAPDLGIPLKGALVSIAFDDGWASVYTHALPILSAHGFRTSQYIITDWIDKPGYQSDYMVSDQLLELSAAGHELGSHSLRHEDMTEVSDLTANLVDSKARLQHLGFEVAGFVPPGGSYNDKVLELVRASYRYMRTVEEGLNYKPYDVYHLKCLVVVNTTTLSEIAAWVQQAAREKGWLILLYHRLGAQAPYDTYVTKARFKEDMDYLAAAGAQVLPLGEVLGVWTRPKPPKPVETGKSLPQPELNLDKGCSAVPGQAGFGGLGLGGLLVLSLLVSLSRRKRR